ncbi:MAG: hypothetical protein COZ06_02325 [Armatimonadetes bacterium CG_4_10_14_3_um_filter_66_18]|nr:VWA domain-containing protein [Armatimonadota bacterium]OIP06040.1 MAG: hypothetical protein AUJ96_09690 [Armatimonadetes bacterium CG2_30_66_41]PIU95685.1 MAG: hypothetical protein COS65_01290 [Armatimonadetes bacterium CG06_land_8_20_14_3_00_66_21]PIX47555.1 MAG: hypothetical protein COZ57_08215 [Armatimonadetes bacterium CG_4_8_14_3_um_filter_66_20]PIY52965.1 MAG: hypothetical protein COZ06_02325 [Armatimonadetes bacterium CG_4_10_14_3_um_filter_66_18]PJB63383.1 MAG: hypothetical protein
MKTTTSMNWITTALTTAGLYLVPLSASCQESAPAAKNRIAVVVDRTGSFKLYLVDAGRKVRAYLNELALTSEDEVYLVAMEATPELVGYFPGTFFTKAQAEMLKEKLGTCTEGSGTDVVGAIELALDRLNMNPQVAARHLLVFSDGIADPAKSPEGVVHNFRRLEDWDWTKLQGVHAKFYYLGTKPYDVKGTLAKLPVVASSTAKKDLELWSDVETPPVPPPPPPPPPVAPFPSRTAGTAGSLPPVVWLAGLGFLLWLTLGRRQQTPPRRRPRQAQRRAN